MNEHESFLDDKTEQFVMHFGEMGSRWGFNRTVGQIFALLVVSEKALSADDIASTLHVSRGNVSMAIKELSSWQLVRSKRLPNDRKDYYMASGSIWQLAMKVIEERRKRELEPTLSLLRDIMMNSDSSNKTAPGEHALSQMKEIHDLLETTSRWTQDLAAMPETQLRTLMRLGSGVSKIISIKDAVTVKNRRRDS